MCWPELPERSHHVVAGKSATHNNHLGAIDDVAGHGVVASFDNS